MNAMHTLSGGCHCGNIGLELELTRRSDTYNPRACDCDFCRKHGAAYVSDPQGSLAIHIRDPQQIGKYRQGSGQAEFLVCQVCGVLAAVLYGSEGRLHAAVNAKAVEAKTGFGPEQPVSPKTLSAGDKAKRWQDVWFSKVAVTS
jgi:hypothetical protein